MSRFRETDEEVRGISCSAQRGGDEDEEARPEPRSGGWDQSKGALDESVDPAEDWSQRGEGNDREGRLTGDDPTTNTP